MIRFLPVVVELFVLVFCLIDCIQTPDHEVRNLPKLAWILLILILPLIGGIAWLVAGRPQHPGRNRQTPWPSTRTAGYPEYERPRAAVAPDDDPEFLAEMRRGDTEQEDLLRKWEEDLKRRERELGGGKDRPADDPPSSSG